METHYRITVFLFSHGDMKLLKKRNKIMEAGVWDSLSVIRHASIVYASWVFPPLWEIAQDIC